MIGGHMITIVGSKRPATYVVGESDVARALDALKHHVGGPVMVPASPVPMTAEEVGEHGVYPGQVKRLLSL